MNNQRQFDLIEPAVKRLSQIHNDTLHHDLIVPIVRRNTIIKGLINANKRKYLNNSLTVTSSSDSYDDINNNNTEIIQKSKTPSPTTNRHNSTFTSNDIHKNEMHAHQRRMSLKYASNLTHSQIDEIKKSKEFIQKIHEYEEISLKLKPEVEGRIIIINNDQVMTLFVW
jgi:membrane carboxypeptidase/penicillin-binding protein